MARLVGFARVLYDRYVDKFQCNCQTDTGISGPSPRSMRTMLRSILRHTDIAVFGYFDASKGSILLGKGTVQMFVSAGSSVTERARRMTSE